MGLITTQHAGFGQQKPDPKQKADPKPVTGFDYAGQPMKPGTFYNGRPEHMAKGVRMTEVVQKNHPSRKENQTPEYREKMRERMAKVRHFRWKKKANPETAG